MRGKYQSQNVNKILKFLFTFSVQNFAKKISRGSEMAAGADLIASQVGPSKTIILFLGSTNLIEGPRVPKCNQEVTVGR